MEKGISAKFTNLGFVAAVLVISIHFHLKPSNETAISLFWKAFGVGIARFAVPFFFLTSGFFLAAHIGEAGWWKRELAKRLRSLGIPYLAWCTLSLLVFQVAMPIFANLLHGRVLLANVSCDLIRTFGLNPLANPAIPAFWYIRNLFLFVLISPILARIKEGGGYCNRIYCLYRGALR